MFNTLNNLTLLDSEAIIKKMKYGVKLKIVLISCVSILSAILIYFLCIGIHSTLSTQAATYYVGSFVDLQTIANNVKNGTNYSGHTVELTCDINGNGADFIGIGGDISAGTFSSNDGKIFAGTFDGKGFTISNIVISKHYQKNSGGATGQVVLHRKGFFAELTSGAKIKNLRLNNVTCNDYLVSGGTRNYSLTTTGEIGILVGRNNGASIENCAIENSHSTITYSTFSEQGGGTSYGGGKAFMGAGTGTISNCYVKNVVGNSGANSLDNCSLVELTFGASGMKVSTNVGGGYYYPIYHPSETVITNSFYFKSSTIAKPFEDAEGSKDNYTTDDISFTNLDDKYWFKPKTTEYNAGYPYLKSFIKWDTYTVTTINGDDGYAIDKGAVNLSSFDVPLPKDDSSTKYIGIPDNNYSFSTFTVAVIDKLIAATPACETCRQFSHWEVSGKTITAHFKEKEVPANCTIKFNGHSFANTTSSIGLFEFKLHPGSTIKCESSDGKTYTYIVVKGGDCPDCGRPLTTGEEYARITYTLKIDPGQPASKYELYKLDSGGFIKGSNTEYTITESTTISPTFILKEYGVEVS